MYEQFYGLSGRPFQLTPDPDFYFESDSHRKALSYLRYGLSQGEGFMVITGEVGAGKSTLVAHLEEHVDPAQLTIGKVVTSALDGEELVQVVAQCFGLDVEGLSKAAVLGAIEMFLQTEAEAGRRCLLVVDESQNLDIEAIEELRMLSNFQMEAHPLLQTLLLGQPEFRTLIANHPQLEQLRQRVIVSHHLEALQADEVQDYITHRLEHVGWAGKPAIPAELFGAINDATDGIPRRINQVMNRLLLLAAVEQREGLTLEMLEGVCAEMAGDAVRGAVPSRTEPSDMQAHAASADNADFAHMLEQRDARIAELEMAVAQLRDAQAASNVSPAPVAVPPMEGEWAEAFARLDARLEEQEQSVRHVLTLLVEWLEEDSPREAA